MATTTRITKIELSTPTVHLNGTSRDELLRQLNAVIDAIDLAENALLGAMPHGRDYYLQPGNAITTALDAHRERLDILTQMRKDFEIIRQDVMES
jgi:hypothetical protein